VSGAGDRGVLARRACAAALLVAGLLAATDGVAWAVPGETLLLSRATGADGAKARGPFYGVSFGPLSGDGEHAAFTSEAPNLDPADTDQIGDVFMRDLQTERTMLVSRADGADGAKGNGVSVVSAVSADGRYVVFRSESSNLDAADGDVATDFYIRDLATHETTLVSRADGGDGMKANAASTHARVSADGRFMVFDSAASNLDPADHDARTDVFVRDLATGQTTLVTPESEAAELAALSSDGSHVAYIISPSFDSGASDTIGVLYVRDLRTGEATSVSRADGADGAAANRPSARSGVSLSADGRRVAFSSSASNLDPADPDRREDVYVRDLMTNETMLVSRADGAGGPKANRESPFGGSLSGSGRFVGFTSTAWNLDPLEAVTNQEWDVYVRDLRTHQTTLASRSSTGAQANESSNHSSLSADGRYLAFYSGARNLDPVDRDYRRDLYRRDLQARLPVPGRPPRTRIDSVRRGKQRFLVVGRARDDHGLQRVELSVTRRVTVGRRLRCQALEGEFWLAARRSGRRCRPRFLLLAHSTRRWQRGIPLALPHGTYTVTSRATDTAGQREQHFSTRRDNIRTIRPQ
jgi:Tol biopolymer transport system component